MKNEIISPTKSKVITTVALFFIGIIFQLILAVMFVSFDTSLFGKIIATIAGPFLWIFFWPVNTLINLVIQEWWILAVYIINIFYIYFLACLLLSIYLSSKNRKK